MPAGVTAAADYLGLDGHLVSSDQRFHFGSNLFYKPRNFVSLDYGIGSVGMPALIDVNVGTAYPEPHDSNQHLISVDFWHWYITKFYSSGFGHNCLFHDMYSWKSPQ
jgi:hypothetical protein